jgi:hypothetical protein
MFGISCQSSPPMRFQKGVTKAAPFQFGMVLQTSESYWICVITKCAETGRVPPASGVMANGTAENYGGQIFLTGHGKNHRPIECCGFYTAGQKNSVAWI